jgi:amino acid adenylation domain-containing protein
MVPNPNVQAKVIEEAVKQAGVSPHTVSYVEAAANGSALGDSIEVAALSKVFGRAGSTKSPCILGSAKSNIGHPEAASGIAQLTKVVLQLRHQRLVPSIKVEPLNPNLRLEETPFTLQRELASWRRPVLEIDGTTQEVPRRALINSFGAGGSYVSLVVEEYASGETRAARPPGTSGKQVVVFSAKGKERLRALVEEMLTFVERSEGINLANLAYTLQVGREAMETRLAFVAQSREDLTQALRAYLATGASQQVNNAAPLFVNDVTDSRGEFKQLLFGKLGESFGQVLADERDLEKLALYWSLGGRVPWASLHDGEAVRKIALPTYPFARAGRYRAAARPPYREAQPPLVADEESRTSLVPDADMSTCDRVRSYITQALAETLKVPPDIIKAATPMRDYGLDSVLGMKLMRQLESAFDIAVTGRELFEHPSVSTLAAFIAAKLDKRPSRSRLSQGQFGLWWLQKITPRSSVYNVPLCVRLARPLDPTLLEQTLSIILDRHPVLANVVREEEGIAYQFRQIGRPPALVQEDISRLADSAVLPYLRQAAKAPFSMEEGPLMRVHLFSRASEQLLLIVVHHIVMDGRSAPLLLKTLFATYRALAAGRSPQIEPPTASYADFVAWEQALLASERGRAHLAYWQAQLAPPIPTLQLPTDRARHASARVEGRSFSRPLAAGLPERVRAFSAAQSVSPAVVFLSVYQMLLYRYTGQHDAIVGMPTVGRHEQRFEDVVGYFVNMIAIRGRVDGDRSFAALLQSLQLTLVDGLDHSAYPFPALVRELKLPAVTGNDPVFQVVFNYLSSSVIQMEIPAFGDETVQLEQGLNQEGEYELVLEVSEQKAGFALNFKYDPELFEPSRIERMSGHYLTLLEGAIEDPHRQLNAYSLLTEEERQQLAEFNVAKAEFTSDDLVHRLFELQVQAQPDAIAVVYQGNSLSYEELNRRANQIAHSLIERELRPEDRVAICVERGLAMVVALLGVLKAAGAYVPLDANAPAERLQKVLSDCSAVAVLTQAHLAAARFAQDQESLSARLLMLDAEGRLASTSCPSHHNPDAAALGLTSRHLAYVIYTSGSTGIPKGVMVEHRSLVNFWHVLRNSTHLNLPKHSRIALNAAYFFDMSMKGLLQLLSGHTVYIVPELTRASGPAFCSFLRQHRIDAVDCTPSQLDGWLAAGLTRMSDYRPKSILIGGEEINAKMWQQLRSSASIDFYNMYGPTEGTIDATIGLIGEMGESPSIGRPVGNVQIYVLDPGGQPLPIGLAGEIHIGGIGVARGYLNRADLTAERFVPDPFSGTAGARMYKTGDIGRWMPDGTVEYLGRNDSQVKIRGFRIEPGEIEAKLVTCPGVRDAVVIAWEDGAAYKRLVAYIVAEEGAELAIGEVRAYLSAGLPGYMVPSAFVTLDAFPLTPNGKLDRSALPPPDSASLVTRAFAAPQGELENKIAQVWQELLGLGRVGRHDDFFELGGHSLLAVQMVSRLGQVLGVDLALGDILGQSVLAGFAAAILDRSTSAAAAQPGIEIAALPAAATDGAPARAASSYSPLVMIQRGSAERQPLICVPGAGASVSSFAGLAQALGPEVPVYGLQPRGLDGLLLPHLDVPSAAETYIAAIGECLPDSRSNLLGHSFGGWVAFEIARQLAAAGHPVSNLFIVDSKCPAHSPATRQPYARIDAVCELINYYEVLIGKSLGLSREALAALDSDKQLNLLLTRLVTASVLPPSTSLRHLRGIVEVFQANLNTRYKPVGPYNGSVHIIGAEGEGEAGGSQHHMRKDHFHGWLNHAPQARYWSVAGTHMSILSAPRVTRLAQLVRRLLAVRARSEYRSIGAANAVAAPL